MSLGDSRWLIVSFAFLPEKKVGLRPLVSERLYSIHIAQTTSLRNMNRLIVILCEEPCEERGVGRFELHGLSCTGMVEVQTEGM